MNYKLPTVALLAAGGLPCALIAQPPAFQLGAVYQCPGAHSFKVLSCAGVKEADLCEVQSYSGGRPNQLGKAPYQQVVALARLCRAQARLDAQSEARASTASQADANGFKIGDTVQINTAFGWVDARILAINGNNYRVRAQTGADVTKTYPDELRRIGAPTAGDRANGVYRVHDKVQVNFEGRWMESEVVVTLGMEYQVKVPGNRLAWVTPQNLRPSTAQVQAEPKAGQPPKPGLTSCAGKIEGRYSSLGGFAGMSIVFRSGKATVAEDDVYECWMGGGRIYLHKPGKDAIPDMPLEINNDGTLDSPMGELKKKGN